MLPVAGVCVCGGITMRQFFKLYIIINTNKMKTGKKTFCVVYKVHFGVYVYIQKYTYKLGHTTIHTNAEAYTA